MAQALLLGITHLDALRIVVGVQGGAHLEAGPSRGGLNRINDYLMVAEGMPAPVQADGAERAMLDFVPFGGSGGKVTYPNLQPCFVGEFLPLCFPEPDTGAVTSSAVRGDHQSDVLRISLFPHHVPPPSNALRCEGEVS